MFFRALASWRAARQSMINAETRLTRLVELAEAAAERQAAAQNRMDLQIHFLQQMELYVARLEYQAALSHPRYASPLRLERFGRKQSSQNDEDGIIAEIFRRIGPKVCSPAMARRTPALQSGMAGLWAERDEGMLHP
jgi:hypothetical protein